MSVRALASRFEAQNSQSTNNERAHVPAKASLSVNRVLGDRDLRELQRVASEKKPPPPPPIAKKELETNRMTPSSATSDSPRNSRGPPVSAKPSHLSSKTAASPMILSDSSFGLKEKQQKPLQVKIGLFSGGSTSPQSNHKASTSPRNPFEDAASISPPKINGKSKSSSNSSPSKQSESPREAAAEHKRPTTPKSPLLTNPFSSFDNLRKIDNPFSSPRQVVRQLSEPLSLADTKRNKVLMEILDTEKAYLKDIRLLHTVYQVPGKKKGIFTGQDAKIIFSNIEKIIAFSQDFIAHLDQGIRSDSVAHAFIRNSKKIESVYSEYCKNNEAALNKAGVYMASKEEKIVAFLAECRNEILGETNAWDLTSFLIKPTQRVLKYPLLLRELVKCTEESHHDHMTLLKAIDEMGKVAEHINLVKKRKDIVDKYVDRRPSSSNVIHGINKKLNRSALQLKQATGLTEVTVDENFNKLQLQFDEYFKLLQFLREGVIEYEEYFAYQCTWAETWQESVHIPPLPENHQSFSLMTVQFNQAWRKIETLVFQKIQKPLGSIIISIDSLSECFKEPSILMRKRADKLLDFDRANEITKSGEEVDKRLKESAEVYVALNEQLQDELPKFFELLRQGIDMVLMQFYSVHATVYKTINNALTIQMSACDGLKEESFDLIRSSHTCQFSEGGTIEALVSQIASVHRWHRREWFAENVAAEPPSPTTKSAPFPPPSPVKSVYAKSERSFSNTEAPGQNEQKERIVRAIGECTVIYPYRSINQHELSLNTGDVIAVLNKGGPYGEDWWNGRVIKGIDHGKTGWFPMHHVFSS